MALSAQTKNRMAQFVWMVLLVAWVAFIWGHSLANGFSSSLESGRAVQILRPLLNAMGLVDEEQMTFAVRKTAHFCEYAVLGMLLYANGHSRGMYTREGSGWWMALALAIPVADEYIQAFVPGRSSQVSDVVLDFVGAVTGLVVVLLIRRIRHR